MKFEILTDMQEYDTFVTHHPMCNLLQSSKWAMVKENWDHVVCGVRNREQELIATASILIKKLPMGFTMFYIPKGPIMDYDNEALVQYMMKSLQNLGRKHHCLYIKFDPGIVKQQGPIKVYEDRLDPQIKQQVNMLKGCGCIHLGYSLSLDDTLQPRFHAAVLKKEGFMDSLPKHTKRHIATAKKKFVKVDICGSERIEEFARLMQLTEERQNIKLRKAHYFKLLMDTYGEDARLFLACIDLDALILDSEQRLEKLQKDIDKCKEKDEKKKATLMENQASLRQEIALLQKNRNEDGAHVTVAGALAVKYGNTCEMLYMGMVGTYRKYMAPYLSHITPMEWSFTHGCTLCNMGGVAGTLDDGLTKFKSNFDPILIEYVGEFDLPVNSLLYRGAQYAFNLRKARNKH